MSRGVFLGTICTGRFARSAAILFLASSIACKRFACFVVPGLKRFGFAPTTFNGFPRTPIAPESREPSLDNEDEGEP
jgi:hypothetical protein